MFMWDWNPCQKNWSAEVRKKINDNDMNKCVDEVHICPTKDVSDTQKDDIEQEWPAKVVAKVKLSTYKQFKTHLA